MANTLIVVGIQWGDEGKGKIVDLLTQQADAVVRFQGGHNAGHTLVVDGETIVLHVVPSGILTKEVQCYIGNGVVVAPRALIEEVDQLDPLGLDLDARLRVSALCPVILPYHAALDEARERSLGRKAIGTTGRGIGPAYEDKVARRGLRLFDLLDQKQCEEKIRNVGDFHNFTLKNYFDSSMVDLSEIVESALMHGERLAPMMADVASELNSLIKNRSSIVFEGAQGSLLAVDHGTYPFVTSSNTTAGAAAVGTGLGPRHFEDVLGIAKAYTTRVGNGPFPTELFNAAGSSLAERGREFGATTGRPRRCGWFDAVSVKHACRLNGVTSLCITKLDVLDQFSDILICTEYEENQYQQTAGYSVATDVSVSRPVYETLPGWQTTTAGVRNWKDLPKEAKKYLQRLSELAEVPVDIISTGPDRDDTTILRHPLDK